MNLAILLQSANPLQNPLTPIILMVVIFYLVLFLPMRRRQRKADEMLKNLKNGDRVVTTGGVIGTIVALAWREVLHPLQGTITGLVAAVLTISMLLGTQVGGTVDTWSLLFASSLAVFLLAVV